MKKIAFVLWTVGLPLMIGVGNLIYPDTMIFLYREHIFWKVLSTFLIWISIGNYLRPKNPN